MMMTQTDSRLYGNFMDPLEDGPKEIDMDQLDPNGTLNWLTNKTGEGYQFSHEHVEVIIYVDPKQGNKGRLAYKIEFVARNPEKRVITNPIYIVDTDTKEVIEVWDNIQTVFPKTFLLKE